MIHGIWSQACRLVTLQLPKQLQCCLQALDSNIHVWIERVSSEDNISDSPSREDYALLSEIGAQWRHPVYDDTLLRHHL